MEPCDAATISSAFSTIGWNKPEAQYIRYMEDQNAGRAVVLVAELGDAFAGYGCVVWESSHAAFREKSIPEVSDLNVLPAFRRKGIATAIMNRAEALIAERSETAGIGFGIYEDYGGAQRMYVLRGYVPDGRGCTSHHKPVQGGDRVRADDALVLWLTKRLR